MKDRSPWYGLARHLFQAYCLGAELQVIMFTLAAGAVFVLHGVRDLTVQFDNVGFTYQTKSTIPNRQSAFDPYPTLNH